MIPHLRREEILKYITDKDIAYIKDLADLFNVSFSTVRRDLIELAEQGEVSLLSGGAVKLSKKEYDEPIVSKKLINKDIKERIAEKAAELVNDGDNIYIDSGTTTNAMFKYLRNKNIVVITSALPNLEEIRKGKMTVIFLGGEILLSLESVVGTITEKLLSTMYFDKAFVGANGYSVEHGVCTFDVREARKKELVKDRSNEVFLLADTSKEGKRAFSKCFELAECTVINEE